MESTKEYLGDAVYAEHDGYSLILTTEDGYRATNRICLEPEVLRELDRYRRELHARTLQEPQPVTVSASHASDEFHDPKPEEDPLYDI